MLDVSGTESDPVHYKVIDKHRRAGFFNTVVFRKNDLYLHYPGRSNDTIIQYSKGNVIKKAFDNSIGILLYTIKDQKYFFTGISLIKASGSKIDTLYKVPVLGNFYLPKVINAHRDPQLIFYSNGKLLKLDFNTDKISELYNLPGYTNIDLNGTGIDDHGNQWLYSKHGALLIKPNGESQWILKGENITSGFLDKSKKWYWLSSFNNKLFKIPINTPIHSAKLGISADHIFATSKGLCVLNNNKLYIRTEKDLVELLDYNGTQMADQAIQKVIIENDNLYIWGRNCIMMAHKGPFTYTNPFSKKIAIKKGSYYYVEEIFAIKDFIFARENNYYVALWNGLYQLSFDGKDYTIKKLTELTGTFKNLILKDSILYFTNSVELVKLDLTSSKKQTIASFATEIKKLLLIEDDFISGFSNKGIVRLRNSKKYIYNTHNTDLISDEIVDIQYSNKGIWINTNEGIQRMDVSDTNATFYKPEFIKGKDLSISIQNNVCYVLNKEIKDQLISFDVDSKNDADIPFLFIDVLRSSTKNNGKDINLLPYLDNFISIKLGAINYQNSRNRYYYQLITDKDSGSFRLMEGNDLSLRSVESGKYRLRFICKNTNGISSNILTYSFSVERPFWDTLWFRISLSLFLAGSTALVVIIYYRRKNKRNKERHEAEYKILQLEQQLFRSLMNPHFIFNSLNSIQGLINNNRHKEAVQNIGVFSQLVRKNLEDSIEGFCTLEEELTRLKLYVEMENLRFNNCILFSIEKEEGINENHLKIPAFIMQPLVENSILHGILPVKTGEIIVKLNYENKGSLKIQIIDSGIGLNNGLKKRSIGEKRSVALNLIGSRFNKLQKIQNKDYRFDIIDRSEMDGKTGTICTLIIPVVNS